MVSDSIPKRIIQFCHIAAEMPKELIEASENTRKNLSDYDYILADDEAVKKLIIDEWDYRLYDWYCRNKIPASRADMARLLLVYKYGGFYIDLSMAMVTPLDAYLKKDVVLLRRDDFERYKSLPEKAHFTNSIIGAPSKSDFIGLLISKMRLNLATACYQYDVINCTGPGLINSIYKEYAKHLNVGSISFRSAKNSMFNYVRVQGFSNKWTSLQAKGILEETGLGPGKKELSIVQPGAPRRLHLHFGWPKVGSTSIQDFYLANPVAEKSYIYPSAGRPNNVRAHHQLVKHKFSGVVADKFIEESVGFPHVIVSSEQGVMDVNTPDFFTYLNYFVKKIGGEFKIHLYIKNIFDFIESAYAQCLRTDLFDIVQADYNKEIKDFVKDIYQGKKSHILQFGKVVSSFQEEIGIQNVNVKVVGFNVPSNDVFLDFSTINGTGLHLENYDSSTLRSNASLSIPEKFVLLLANQAGLGRDSKLKILHKYNKQLLKLAVSLPRKSDFCNIVSDECLSDVKKYLDYYMPDNISKSCLDYVYKEPSTVVRYVKSDDLYKDELIRKVIREIDIARNDTK